MKIYILIYLFFLLFSLLDFSSKKNSLIFYWLSFLFILFIAFRGTCGTDSLNYITFFTDQTDTIWDWKGVEKGYAEYGFYYLSVLIKSCWNNSVFYFFIISCLTFFFLITSLKNYSVYPIIGLCVYYSRFLLFRDMNQIRAALAIVIVIYALKFLGEKEKRNYFMYVIIAITIHYSAIIGVVFGFLYNVKVSFRSAILLLVSAGIVGYAGGMIIKNVLLSTGNVIMLTYVDTQDLGLGNPIIYYQVLLCLLFFYCEKSISKIQKNYYVIRNAYLFSTAILLLTCNLGEIGGRLSTLFATCEIFILPALIYSIRPRMWGYFCIIAVITIIFILNYAKISSLPTLWTYPNLF